MTPYTTELLTYLDDCRADLRAAVDAIPRERRDRPPAEGRWSVAGVLEHLSVTEASVARLVARLADDLRRNGRLAPPPASSSLLATIDLDTGVDRSRRLEAPDRIQPRQGLDADAAWAALEAARAELRAIVTATDGLALAEASFPHRFFGPLNGYEWIVFVGTHERRHTAQIREIGGAADSLSANVDDVAGT